MGARLSVLSWQLVLMYPLDHDLVPRHRRATADDLRLLAPLHIHRRGTMLPALRADDPIVQYLDWAGPAYAGSYTVPVCCGGNHSADRPPRRQCVLPRGCRHPVASLTLTDYRNASGNGSG